MSFSIPLFLNQLDERIEAKHLLKHEFYLAWSKGLLSKECLAEYAKEYYFHVQAFPTYLSSLHAHTSCPKTRRHILNNLIEEEAGEPNHPDLWKSFAFSLGVKPEELAAHQPSQEIQDLIQIFRTICQQGSVEEGIAALYAYESQIPPICVSKIQGLKEHYGLKEASDWKYFSVHIAADEEHAAIERQVLSEYLSQESASKVETAVQKVLEALWNFLSSLCHRYQISCAV
jgi:pyrroloquinoline-quinone synthase